MRTLTISQLSLAGSSGIAEAKQLIWSADGASVGFVTATSGGLYLVDGGTTSSSVTTATKLVSLSSTWQSVQKIAFEVTLWVSSGTNTAYATLYDLTSTPTVVSNAQVSTTATTATVLRSSQFTLTPGHTYGVSVWGATTSTVIDISDASLIIFPS